MSATPETARAAVPRLFKRDLGNGYHLAGCHRYTAPDGRELFRMVRLKHSDKPKIMRPMYRDGLAYKIGRPERPAAGWPLYQPPYPLVMTDPVLLVEGEACADALAKRGITAFTSGGSSSEDAAAWTLQAGPHYVMWPDHDNPGTQYATAVVAKLRALGCDVQLVEREVVESLPAHGDVMDWLAQHPDATAEDIRALPTTALPQLPASVDHDAPHVVLLHASDVKPEAIRWLWPGWLARGKLHVIAGAPGTAKTTIVLQWAACITAGLPFPSGHKPPRGRVVIWSGEDDPADTLTPRLMAAGADLTRIEFVHGVEEGADQYAFDPARDVPLLAVAMAGMDDVAMIVIDPLVSAVSADSHKNAEVRRSLQPLVDLAERMDAVLIGVTHYSKGTQAREPLERVTGSLAFGALARLVFGTAKQKTEDDTAPTRYLLARVKSNIGPDGGGYAYGFEQVTLPGGIEANKVVFGEALEGSARELIGQAEAEPDDDTSESGECANWLRDELTGNARDAKEMQRDGLRLGYSAKVIRRAREKLGVKPQRLGFGPGSRIVLSLMPIDAIDAQQKEWAPMEEKGIYGAEHPKETTDHAGDIPHPSGTDAGVEVFNL